MDITQLILDQHAGQRQLFAYLEEIPRDDLEGLAAVWHQLENFLLLHAEAEELYFYPELAKIGTGGADAPSNTEQITDAIKDHNEIRDAIQRVRSATVGSDEWWAAVINADVANSDHMGEEERQDLADFRQQASLELRHEIAVAFLRRQAIRWEEEKIIRDRDPEQYVDDAENAPTSDLERAAARLEETQTATLSSGDPEPSLRASRTK